MTITAAKLQAEVGADTSGFDKGMRHADQTVAAAPRKWSSALKLGAGAGLGIAAGLAVKGLIGTINAGLSSLRAEGVVVAQSNAVIRSTGSAAHVTSSQVRELSKAIEDKTAIDDKQIQAGANMLLTFTNIRNEAGRGNDIFNQSVSVLADVSTAMGTDAKSGAIQLGKALNDPVLGITALTRVGVTFTDAQKNQIKALVGGGKAAKDYSEQVLKAQEAVKVARLKLHEVDAKDHATGSQRLSAQNRLADATRKLTALELKQSDARKTATKSAGGIVAAQKIILAELNKEFGGSGAAFAETDAGKAAKFQDAIEGIQQSLARGVLPAVTRVRGALDGFLRDPATIGQAEKLGVAIGNIFSEGNLKTASGLMVKAADAVSSAIKLFVGLPGDVQALAVGAIGLKKITGIGPLDIVKGAGGLVKMVFERGTTPANPLFVADVSGGLGTGVAGAGGLGLLGAAGIAAAIVVAAVPIGEAFASALPDWLKGGPGANTGKTESQLAFERGQAAMAEKRAGDSPALHGAAPNSDRSLDSRALHNATAGATQDLDGLSASARSAAAQLRLQSPKLMGDLSHIIAGITARSAAAHGGHALGAGAIDRTFQRDLVHEMRMVHLRTGSTADKIEALKRIAALAASHKDWGVAHSARVDINHLRASVHGTTEAVKTGANRTVRTLRTDRPPIQINPQPVNMVVNGRVLASTIARYTTGGRAA